MTWGRNMYAHKLESGARFRVTDKDPNHFEWYTKRYEMFLDKLMKQVPGKDNYPGILARIVFFVCRFCQFGSTPLIQLLG